MSILLIGLNHRTAPVEIREKLAFSQDGAATALMLFRRQFPNSEAAILSTCNRVELIINADDADGLDLDRLVSFLAEARGVPAMSFKQHLYMLQDDAAVKQVFRVITGLDSMVIGEYQIVNQLKQAYQRAHEQQTAGPVLHRLFHFAFGVGKRTRSETGICEGKTSIPSVAVEMIRRHQPEFASSRILIVGAGEMAQMTAEYLREAEAKEFAVTTRTLQNARTLAASVSGEAVPFAELDEQLVKADVVITATSCPAAILTVPRMQRSLAARGGRQMLLVDLSVPRNIAAEVAELEGVTLYDVDSLGRMVDASHRNRLAAAELCERIIDEEVAAFAKWLEESKVRPVIEQMYNDVRALVEVEVRSTLRRCSDLTDKQREAVEQLAERIVGKLMHPCVCAVRAEAAGNAAATTLAETLHATRMAFGGFKGSQERPAEAVCIASR